MKNKRRMDKFFYVFICSHATKGYQLIYKTNWLKFAINVERLRKRGLIFLLDQYKKVHAEIN